MLQVKVKTEAAEYQLVKPAAAYKEIFGHMLEQCEIACQVCRICWQSIVIPALL